MSETKLSAAIATALKLRGHKVLRIIPGKIQEKRSGNWLHGAPKGTPDRCVLTKYGRTVWLEVKLPGEGLSEDQKKWFDWALSHGHEAGVVTSVKEALWLVGDHE